MSQRHSSRFHRGRVFSRRLNRRRPMMEILERRQLLATDTWISPTSGSWDVASNWSTGAVPGPGDDVVINVAGATPTVTISSQVESVRSVNASDPLVISGGGLTVSATSTIGGTLSMTGGTLTATGAGVVLTVTRATTFSGGNLTAEGGATLSLPGLTAYTADSSTLEATGAGSLLDLSNVTSVTDTGADDQVEAMGGGTVDLSGLATMTADMDLEADGAGSMLDVPALASFSASNTFVTLGASLTAQDGGKIDSGSLTTINGVRLALSDTASISVGQLSDIDDSGVLVEGGAKLSLPLVTSYEGAENMALEATGVGSELDLTNLTSVTDTGTADQIEAMDGGTVDLSGLATMTANIDLEANGAGSTLKIPTLTSFSVGSTFIAGGASLTAEDGGQIDSGSLTKINSVRLTLSDTASISVGQLSDIDDSGVLVEGGAMLSLAARDELPGIRQQTAGSHRDRERARPARPGQRDEHVGRRLDRSSQRRDREPDRPDDPERQYPSGSPGQQ